MLQFRVDDLRLRCFQRADMVEGSPIDKNEANRLISEKYGELYGMPADSGMRCFVSEQTITATGAASYAIPTDYLSSLDVEWVYDAAGHRRRLRRLRSVQDRWRWIGMTGDARRWDREGQQLYLFPTPPNGTYKHLYVAQPTDLSNVADSTMVDVVTNDGLAFLIWCVAAAMASTKKEADVSYMVSQYEAARERFQSWCAGEAALESSTPYVDAPDEFGDVGVYSPASLRWNPP